MKAIATKQLTNESVKQNKSGEKGRSRSVSPLSTGMPLLQRKCACGGGCPRCKEELGIQTKLKISEPGDKYEQQADRIADEVMRMPEPSVQRQLEPEEEEEEMVQRRAIANPISPLSQIPLQRRSNNQAEPAEVPSIVHDALRSPGQPLDLETRTFLESRFGRDFNQVQVHTDSRAAMSAQTVNALAYTVGRNIVFGAGQYSPGTNEGKRLIAHELTHVMQQNRLQDYSKVQRQPVVPDFRDCTPEITGIPDANERLENARQRAREYIGAARRVLANAPAAGSTYATALNRHFINPTAADRAAIENTYSQILPTLVERNYICNSNNICGGEQAFWIPHDDLIHICRPFWPISLTCRGIILIHEGAHDIGLGIGSHPPNRGSADYPAGNTAPPGGQTTADRRNNPDAYAFFAAHIWRATDTGGTCF